MTFSVKQYFERMGGGQLRGDDPMDAGYVWTLADNVAHLVDESGKCRINFLHSALEAGSSGYTFGPKIQIYFRTDIIGTNKYPRYDVRVAMWGTDLIDVRASIVIPTVSTVSSADDFGVLGTFTGTTPDDDTVAWTIDGTVGDVNVARCPMFTYPAVRFPGQEAVIGNQVVLKLLVEYDYADVGDEEYGGGGNATMVGAQVREYIV